MYVMYKYIQVLVSTFSCFRINNNNLVVRLRIPLTSLSLKIIAILQCYIWVVDGKCRVIVSSRMWLLVLACTEVTRLGSLHKIRHLTIDVGTPTCYTRGAPLKRYVEVESLVCYELAITVTCVHTPYAPHLKTQLVNIITDNDNIFLLCTLSVTSSTYTSCPDTRSRSHPFLKCIFEFFYHLQTITMYGSMLGYVHV